MKRKLIIKRTYILYLSLLSCAGYLSSCGDDEDASPVHTVSSISPTSGPERTEVTITGTDFGTSTSNIRVSFNGISAVVIASTETSITTSVPADATTGAVMVTIGTSLVNGPSFMVTEPGSPTVVSYAPASAASGATVTITGKDFSTTVEDNVVWFNGVKATIIAATSTTITTIVPVGATTGIVTLEVAGKMGTGPEFEVIQLTPIVDSYNKTIGAEGAPITISGKNFNPVGKNIVTFNGGVTAIITSASPTTIMTTVPTGALSGPVTVELDGKIGTGPRFSVLRTPIIKSYDRSTALAGNTVIISGDHFSEIPAENIVSFGGIAAKVMASTFKTLAFTVPEGAVTTSDISVTLNGLKATGTDEIEIIELLTSGSQSIPLQDNNDDVEEVAVSFGDPVGKIATSSSDLEIGEISSGDGLMTIGLQFHTVAIEQGASIASAFVQFTCDAGGSDPVEVTIYGENAANPVHYDGTDFEVSSRSLTTANAVWNIPEWVSAGDRLPAQQTVDLKDIIQEIVNRPDWLPGGTINIIMKNTGVSATATSSSGGREAEDYSSSKPNDGAALTITLN